MSFDPPAALLEEVGRLCVAWSFLEAVLEAAIWQELEIDEELGQHVTYRLDCRARWQLLMTVLEERDQKEHERLAVHAPTLRSLNRLRNQIVHGRLIMDGDHTWHWANYRNGFRHQPATTEDATRARAEIVALAEAIRPSLHLLPAEPAWRDTSP